MGHVDGRAARHIAVLHPRIRISISPIYEVLGKEKEDARERGEGGYVRG